MLKMRCYFFFFLIAKIAECWEIRFLIQCCYYKPSQPVLPSIKHSINIVICKLKNSQGLEPSIGNR